MHALRNLFLGFSAFLVLAGSAPYVANAANLDVVFEATPLFSEANILPGDTVTRSAQVSNLTDAPQDVYVKAVNAAFSGTLSDALTITVKKGATTYFSESLTAFLDGTPRALTQDLAASDSEEYAFIVSFAPGSANEYQDDSVVFDFCIGFAGGPNTCITDGVGGDKGEATIASFGGESHGGGDGPNASRAADSGSGGGNGGGGTGGNGGGAGALVIFNEKASGINDAAGNAAITWNTNMPATSRVVYGPRPDAAVPFPYVLDVTDQNFGYPNTTVENPLLAEIHGEIIEGLAPGTYVARVVSRTIPGGAETVSPQFTFTLAPNGTLTFARAAGTTGSGNVFGKGAGGGSSEATTTEEVGGFFETLTLPAIDNGGPIDQAAAAALSVPAWLADNLSCLAIALAILVFAYIAWSLFDRRRGHHYDHIERAKIRNAYFLAGSSLGIILMAVLGYLCVLPFLLFFAIVFLIWYIVLFFQERDEEGDW